MASIRDIKQRIKSVKSTQQITNAMNLVASSKLQKAKSRLNASNPYFNELQRILANIVEHSENINHFCVTPRVIKNSLIIIVTGDKGLCGAYNANILKEAIAAIEQRENVKIIVTGNRGVEYFSGKNYNVIRHIKGISDKPYYEDAAQIGNLVYKMYASGEVDEVLIAYTEFISTLTHIAKVITLLPFDSEKVISEGESTASTVMEFEPEPEIVLDYILPKYVNTLVYKGLIESAACELASRTTSMDNATNNASDRIDAMTLTYNKARQYAITSEIIEIVAGASALN